MYGCGEDGILSPSSVRGGDNATGRADLRHVGPRIDDPISTAPVDGEHYPQRELSARIRVDGRRGEPYREAAAARAASETARSMRIRTPSTAAIKASAYCCGTASLTRGPKSDVACRHVSTIRRVLGLEIPNETPSSSVASPMFDGILPLWKAMPPARLRTLQSCAVIRLIARAREHEDRRPEQRSPARRDRRSSDAPIRPGWPDDT